MDCVFGSQNKRRLEEDLENWEHFGPSKKLCDGVGIYSQSEYSMLTDCPMNTWEIHSVSADHVNKISGQDPKMARVCGSRCGVCTVQPLLGRRAGPH